MTHVAIAQRRGLLRADFLIRNGARGSLRQTADAVVLSGVHHGITESNRKLAESIRLARGIVAAGRPVETGGAA